MFKFIGGFETVLVFLIIMIICFVISGIYLGLNYEQQTTNTFYVIEESSEPDTSDKTVKELEKFNVVQTSTIVDAIQNNNQLNVEFFQDEVDYIQSNDDYYEVIEKEDVNSRLVERLFDRMLALFISSIFFIGLPMCLILEEE